MEVQKKAVNRWYELCTLFLAILNVYLSFSAGRFLGFKGAELAGYSTGPLVLVLIVVGIARLMKRARTTRAMSKVAFFTLLFLVVATSSTLMQAWSKLSAIPTAISPESLNVDEGLAVSLASQIQDAVSKGQPDDLQVLFDADRFITKALLGQDTKSRDLQDVARGGSKSFAQNRILEQMALMVKQGGEFNLVKLYKREQAPILQFRLTEVSGNLHYLDFYIYTTKDGKLRIDDLRYYNSGGVLSKQVMTNAAALGNTPSGLDGLQNAIKLTQEGKSQEASDILESLPDDLKQQRIVMRLRMQLAYQVGSQHAADLFREFKDRFPDDPGVVFSAFTGAINRDDVGDAAALIGDIYEAVNGDEYLLWHKVNLLISGEQYKKAIETLSEMETKYRINVVSIAESRLPTEFLSSKDYKVWQRQHREPQ